jgi:hypothetical protein
MSFPFNQPCLSNSLLSGTSTGSVGLLDEELGSTTRCSSLVEQVRAGNNESASANKVSGVAEDLGAVLRVAGNLALVF